VARENRSAFTRLNAARAGPTGAPRATILRGHDEYPDFRSDKLPGARAAERFFQERGTGQHGHSTGMEAIEAIRQMAGKFGDGEIAATLTGCGREPEPATVGMRNNTSRE